MVGFRVVTIILMIPAIAAGLFAEIIFDGGTGNRIAGKGVLAGFTEMFAKFPQNRAVVHERNAVEDTIVRHEDLFRSKAPPPFEVISIDSFAGEWVERVEFVR